MTAGSHRSCGCCCGIIRGINDYGIENSVAQANYFAVIDLDECRGCGTCIERCQVHAISDKNGVSVVDRKRCIGCGLCVTGCPNNVARLERKPGAETVSPSSGFWSVGTRAPAQSWLDQVNKNVLHAF